MKDPKDDQDKIRQLLKSQPVLTPPESFYRGVRQRIAQSQPTRGRFWSLQFKIASSMAVVLLVGLVIWNTPHKGGIPVQMDSYSPLPVASAPTPKGKSEELKFRRSELNKETAEKQNGVGKLDAYLAQPVRLQSKPAASPTTRVLQEGSSPSAGLAGAGARPRAEQELARNRSLEADLDSNQPTGTLQSKSFGYSTAKDRNWEHGAEGVGIKRESTDEVRDLIANTPPASDLSKRKDVAYQARDMGGAASQSSFSREQKKPASTAAPDRVVKESETSNAGNEITTMEWNGTHGLENPQTIVIKSQDQWKTLWQTQYKYRQPSPLVPTIDFNTSMVIGVYAGTKPSGGFSIQILDVQTNTDHIRVLYRETSPTPGTPVTLALTRPFHLRVIPKSDLPVHFVKQ